MIMNNNCEESKRQESNMKNSKEKINVSKLKKEYDAFIKSGKFKTFEDYIKDYGTERNNISEGKFDITEKDIENFDIFENEIVNTIFKRIFYNFFISKDNYKMSNGEKAIVLLFEKGYDVYYYNLKVKEKYYYKGKLNPGKLGKWNFLLNPCTPFSTCVYDPHDPQNVMMDWPLLSSDEYCSSMLYGLSNIDNSDINFGMSQDRSSAAPVMVSKDNSIKFYEYGASIMGSYIPYENDATALKIEFLEIYKQYKTIELNNAVFELDEDLLSEMFCENNPVRINALEFWRNTHDAATAANGFCLK